MAKARSRVAARKIKDKWKAKAWYAINAPAHFGNAKIAETLADDPQKVMGRIAETTLQELTGDFKQMHVKLAFKVDSVDGQVAKTHFVGHSLTSDYIRRMTRRNHSKIDAVVDVTTKDGGLIRVKPFAVSDRRTQTTQASALRHIMARELLAAGEQVSLNRFVRDIVDGKLANQIYKACKPIYPVRRIEINKTEVRHLATSEIEEDWSEYLAPATDGAAAEPGADGAPATDADGTPAAPGDAEEAADEVEDAETVEVEATADAKE